MTSVKKVMPLFEEKVHSFNPEKDIKRVEPASILLLSEVLASGVVPPDTTDLDSNEIENPENIAGRVTNVFDAVDLSREIAKSGANASGVKPAPAPESTSTASASTASSTSTSTTSTLSGEN